MSRYEMQVNRSGAMEHKAMLTLRDIYLAPYMQLATALIGKCALKSLVHSRRSGRHSWL